MFCLVFVDHEDFVRSPGRDGILTAFMVKGKELSGLFLIHRDVGYCSDILLVWMTSPGRSIHKEAYNYSIPPRWHIRSYVTAVRTMSASSLGSKFRMFDRRYSGSLQRMSQIAILHSNKGGEVETTRLVPYLDNSICGDSHMRRNAALGEAILPVF